MGRRFTLIAFLVICIAAIGAAAIRVVTASDRVKQRRDTARSVCAQSGGKWIKVDNEEICRRPDDLLKRG